jgi:hypothetical protein
MATDCIRIRNGKQDICETIINLDLPTGMIL